MAKIFISYRRDDSAYATGVIRDALARELPGCEIFFDVDSIPYGVDFRRHLEGCVGACELLIAVVGKRWLTVTDTRGNRRIDDPNDAVRVEVETALNREIPLVPVFLDGMDVPAGEMFPDTIRNLIARNAIFVRPPPDFNHDVDKLVQSIRRWFAHEFEPAPAAAALPSARRFTLPHMLSRRGALALVSALAVSLALAAWYSARPAAFHYQLGESYLFEDGNPSPDTWKPHDRMVGGGFKLPLDYVHWVIRVQHPPGIAPTQVPLEVRLLDESGEIVKFTGLSETLPDARSPEPGVAEWLCTFGGRGVRWQPGRYTAQLNTSDASIEKTFEVRE